MRSGYSIVQNEATASERTVFGIPFRNLDNGLYSGVGAFTRTTATTPAGDLHASWEVETFNTTDGWVQAAANAAEDGNSGQLAYVFSQGETNHAGRIGVRFSKAGYATQYCWVTIIPATAVSGAAPLLEVEPSRTIAPSAILVFDFFVKNALISTEETDMNVGKTGLTEAVFTVDACLGGSVTFETIADAGHAIIELGGGWYRLTAAAAAGYSDENGEALVRVTYDPDLLPESGGYHSGVIWQERYVVATATATVTAIGTDVITADSIAASALAEIAFAVWSQVLEGSHTAGDMVRGIMSNVGAKVSGFLTGVLAFRNLSDTLDRWHVTTNADGRASVDPVNLTEPGAP